MNVLFLTSAILLTASVAAAAPLDEVRVARSACGQAAATSDQAASESAASRAERLLAARLADGFDPDAALLLAQVKMECRIPWAGMMARGQLFVEIETLLEKVVEQRPDDFEARMTWGTLLYHAPAFLGRVADGVAQLERAREISERGDVTAPPDLWVMLGDLHARSGRDDEAARIWARGLELFPGHEELVKRVTPSRAGESAAVKRQETRAHGSLEDEIALLGTRAVTDSSVPGGSVAVMRGGEILHASGFGTIDLEHRVPATADSVYRLGSISKQFTAVALLRLVEKGAVSLDDPLRRWFPESPAWAASARIDQLLTHTAGFPRDLPVAIGADGRDWIARAFSVSPVGTPGMQFHYSNLGYALAGEIIERASGERFETFAKREVIDRAKLSRTVPCDPLEIIPGRASGYQVVGNKLLHALPLDDSPTVRFAGAWCSSAVDLAKFHHALVTGRIVSPELVERMIEPVTLADGSLSLYGLATRLESRDGKLVRRHDGGVNGFVGRIAYHPDDDLFIAVLMNSEAARPWEIEEAIAALPSSLFERP